MESAYWQDWSSLTQKLQAGNSPGHRVFLRLDRNVSAALIEDSI